MILNKVNKMKLFTVGPVEMYPDTLKIEGTQQPYFRTPEFSGVMLEIERCFMKSVFAANDAHFICLTCSGTGAMEASVVNVLNENDKVLVINGGSFGNRFKQICTLHDIPNEEYHIAYGDAFNKNEFEKFNNQGFTALLVNVSETSTTQKYDLDYLGDFCRRNGMILIVDAVSAYLADPIYMEKQGIDVLLTASQKALSLAPGLALVAISDRVYKSRVMTNKKKSYYFDFVDYVENQHRGQPPFTSAVGTVLSLCQRLKDIDTRGVEDEWAIHKKRADYFREKIKALPVSLPDFEMSNSCTAVLFDGIVASNIYENLKEKYEIILTPSGGNIKDRQLRVGHLGNLTLEDYDYLIEKMKEEFV